MKRFAPFLAVLLVAGCNADSDPPTVASSAPAPAATAPTPAAEAPGATEVKTGSATGVVQAVDSAARTVTIAHGPVESLGWPGMTMTFQAPDVDLSTIAAGDEVDFDFTATGMKGTIQSISKK